MSRAILNALRGRLSLRRPQAESLERLAQAIASAPALLAHERDLDAVLTALKGVFPTLQAFEREFPSLCFALATGVGKTRLMGAFIAYLHLAHGLRHFFVLAPNLTIYNKLIADFTPNTPKYVFTGIAEFAAFPPEIITGDNYEQRAGNLSMLSPVTVNLFNISKINAEVRGGKCPRIKRLSEYLGDSYFNYLSALPDLILLMDESHRYRASAGGRAINELLPLLGLELTATPFVEAAPKPIPFKNVVLDYPLARAMADGFVTEPAVVTQRNFDAQADSSKTGKDEEVMIERLLKVERPDEPTKIVIHVNMLKEGWDVTNLYTIVPLRVANARTLIEPGSRRRATRPGSAAASPGSSRAMSPPPLANRCVTCARPWTTRGASNSCCSADSAVVYIRFRSLIPRASGASR